MSPSPAGRRFRLRFWPTIITMAGLLLLLGLGTWQAQRLAWKTGLIAQVEARLAEPPVPLPEPGADLSSFDFRRVEVRGTYRHDAAFAFGLQASGNEPGARLITPLRLDDGRVLLVDRGWLPEPLLPPNVPDGLQPEDTVARTGVLRLRGEVAASWLTPTSQPDRRRWFAWDMPALENALGMSLLPAVLVLERSEGSAGLPRTGPVRVELRNDHLGYALTWYGLAVGLLVIYLLFSFTPAREGNP